ncbi:MAG: M16 family metallopeptidase [Candidatus Aquicultorales bacterium]
MADFYERTTLPSGMRVISEKIPHVRSVAIGFWVRVGSRDEKEADNGMSHFIEHLVFKGTKTRSAREISETFDGLGAELNAFTTKEYTCYYTRLLDEHVPVGIEVLSDMLQHPRFDESDIVSERNVILEEINLHEDSPDERIHDIFATAVFEGHPLGKPILGFSETVGDFDGTVVRRFYDEHYRPENMAVVAAGNIDHSDLVELVQKYTTRLLEGRPVRKEFKPKIERKVEVYTKPTEQAHIIYGTKAYSVSDERRFALNVLDTILGGGMSSRLFQEIREKRGLVYSVYSYHSAYAETGTIAVYAGTAPQNAELVVELSQKEIDNILKMGVGKEELERSREHIKGQLVLGLESTSRRMTRLGRAEMTHGEFLSMDEVVRKVDGVTVDIVNEIAHDLFENEMVLAAVGPFEMKALAHLVA